MCEGGEDQGQYCEGSKGGGTEFGGSVNVYQSGEGQRTLEIMM